MNRKQLAHICRAAARIAEDPAVLVIGSQSILGSFDERILPAEATRSVEADIAFFDDPDEAKADDVDGSIGEGSLFHDMNGYYGQGVSITTAILPAGWMERLVLFSRDDTAPGNPVCLDPHDLAASKLAAGREKDMEFVRALVQQNLLSRAVLIERTETLETDVPAIRQRARERAESM